MSPPQAAALIRGTITDPARPSNRVPFFAGHERAVQHLGDHVLTAPECEAWLLVVPQLSTLLDLLDANSRDAFFRDALASAGVSAQAVFDLYREAVDRAAGEAHLLGWYASEGLTTVALGANGVLLIVSGAVLVTAYLPGQGSAAAVRSARETASGRLERERGLMRRKSGASKPHDRARERRALRWSAEERLFYQVVRPAVQFLRSCYHRSYTLDGLRTSDIALLKSVLPPMSRFGLADWVAYRARVAGGQA